MKLKIKKASFILSLLLVLSLTIIGCTTTPQRPNPPNNTAPRQGMQENMNTNMNQPGVENDAAVNDNRTRNNMMPNTPVPGTPAPIDRLTFDQINEFDLEVTLMNKDKIDMEYKKGSKSDETKIENRINGRSDKVVREEASSQIEDLIRQIPISSLADTTSIIDGTLSALRITREDVKEFSMDFQFENGEKVKIELNKK